MELASQGRRLGVLISGRGTNLQSIIDAIGSGRLNAAIGIVISNRADAAGLARARDAGLQTLFLSHKEYASREEYDRALVAALRAHGVDLVCLAGFMRIFSAEMLDAYPQRILNIHPSLLPAFPGLHPQRQAIEYGVRYSGATVHVVDAALDGGPIVVQAVVPVADDDTEETLASRILAEEHRIYPEAIRVVLDGGWSVDGRRFVRRRA
ncbi:MAG TPA: phosphoribosylglycinamide formyltransferase [Vicinamibacterales bacterium]|nr:phosphoribosylglycinamide formyltransferase [Vicinamibacterales bacterium]